jgi:hypothetical protein
MRISETLAAGTLVEYVDEQGHHYLDGSTWRVEALTADEAAWLAAEQYAAANPPPSSADVLDQIIMAVLS